MATWTSEDIAAVRAAIVALASGARVASVSFAGPPARTVSYATAPVTAAPPPLHRCVNHRRRAVVVQPIRLQACHVGTLYPQERAPPL
jgi:hypothetical protein